MPYSVMNLFCFAIMCFLIYRTIIDKNVMKTSKKLVLASLCAEALLYLVDAFGYYNSSGAIPVPLWINAFVHSLYFIMLAATCHGVFLLLEALDDSPLYYNDKLRWICSSTGVLLVLASVVTFILCLTNTAGNDGSGFSLLFYIDQNGVYHRGMLNWLQLFCSLTYLLVILVHGIVGFIKNQNIARRSTYLHMIFFVVPPTLLGVLQIAVLPDYPMLAFGVTFSTLVLYFHLVQNQILTDSLTQVNNRNALYKYLQSELKNANDSLYLFMIDLDKFKSINDTYGHIEGDKAILLFSNALKQFAKETDYFIARYGGDEFVIVGEIHGVLADVIYKLNKYVEDANRDPDRKYDIAMTYGYASYSDKYSNCQEFIDAADKMLYKNKQVKQNSKNSQ